MTVASLRCLSVAIILGLSQIIWWTQSIGFYFSYGFGEAKNSLQTYHETSNEIRGVLENTTILLWDGFQWFYSVSMAVQSQLLSVKWGIQYLSIGAWWLLMLKLRADTAMPPYQKHTNRTGCSDVRYSISLNRALITDLPRQFIQLHQVPAE